MEQIPSILRDIADEMAELRREVADLKETIKTLIKGE